MGIGNVTAAALTAFGLALFSPFGLADHEVPARLEAPPGPSLQVVTLNLAREARPERILAEWTTVPALRRADVFLLQEVVHYAGEEPSVATLLAQEMGYYVTSEPNLRKQDVDGLAILSRYPLRDVTVRQLDRFDLGFRSRTRIMIGATVDAPWGPVRIYNAHLDTRINGQQRLRQLAPVLEDARQYPGPKLIAGDFNTNYLHWVRSVLPLPVEFQGKSLCRELQAQGYTTPFLNTGPTFDHFGFQLDWVFTSGLRTYNPQVQPLRFSDHHALVVNVAQ